MQTIIITFAIIFAVVLVVYLCVREERMESYKEKDSPEKQPSTCSASDTDTVTTEKPKRKKTKNKKSVVNTEELVVEEKETTQEVSSDPVADVVLSEPTDVEVKTKNKRKRKSSKKQ